MLNTHLLPKNYHKIIWKNAVKMVTLQTLLVNNKTYNR